VHKIEVLIDREWVEVSDQASVEKFIQENNMECFLLTEDTPLMQEPLCMALSILGTSPGAQQILNGSYTCLDGTNEYTSMYINTLQQPQTMALPITTMISCRDFTHYWKKARECISLSISNLHFGHWMASARSNFLSETHTLFIDIVGNTIYSPFRWQSGLMAMLKKVLGQIWVDGLQAILLMEADFNFYNKLIFGS